MGNDTSSRLKVPTINAKNNKDVPIQAQGKTDQFLIFSFLLLFNLITSFANEQVLFERFKLALEMLINQLERKTQENQALTVLYAETFVGVFMITRAYNFGQISPQ